jgi:N-acetylmuramoyl-L-alanine amidase
MKKTIVAVISVILVSVITIGALTLGKKEENSSKITKKNSNKVLTVKEDDDMTRNTTWALRGIIREEAQKQQVLKDQAAKQAAKEVAEKIAQQALEAQKLAQQKADAAIKTSSGKVIVIDPGHAIGSNLVKEQQAPGSSIYKIKDGGGAEGVVTHTPEYLVNMLVAMKLKQNLEKMGYKVVMTKTDNSLSLGNIERANIGNESNAALVIRIHADSSESNATRGASMLVPAPINENTKAIYSESKRCGQAVLNTLINQVGMQNRGVVERDDMTGFNWSKVPVILVEMGFLSNPDEDRILSTSEYQTKLAMALANGIQAAIK